MDKTYNHTASEKSVYILWEKASAFSPEGAHKLRKAKGLPVRDTAYSVLMPPPNANAPLHAGHVTYSIQDLMIRFKRMQGYTTAYFPGVDHAGFETQVVYERHLKDKGKSRFDFDRETFYNDVLKFVNDNSTVAIDQLKRIGMSADWDRNTFMLDDYVVDTVYDTFLKMYKDEMVYRDGYMVNYSTYYGTSFSDLETEYKDSVSPLYYVKYKLKDSAVDKSTTHSGSITVATVRPETIYADVAIAVNPADKRYKDLIGKTVINPLTQREMPIIADDYVDIEFGTGALKITPGHDFNDFQIGKKHNLEVVTVINLDGTMNKLAKEVAGMYPKPARKKVAEILATRGALEKVDEKYENRVLVDYKDGYPIEPLVLPNWFINMERLSDRAIEVVKSDKVKFNQPTWKREMLRWLEARKPWPISRQTVFGIRIPAWYSVSENPGLHVTFIPHSSDETVSGSISELLKHYSFEDIQNGLQKIIADEKAVYVVSKTSPGENYLQETDTFDTWFSSGQWPFTTTKYPNGADFKKYFPSDMMDSMWDIMFFWIARMIMFSLYLTDEIPFKYVYFHGMITDKAGKKMSKSKGNSINPLEYVDKYGADALRMGIIVGGNTEAKVSPFDEDKVRGYRNFANKMWNVGRFLDMKIGIKAMPDFHPDMQHLQPEDDAIIEKLNTLIQTTTLGLDRHKFKLTGEALYQFMWDDFANGYLEQIKNRDDVTALSVARYVFSTILKLLHPYMPFITEAVWQQVSHESDEPDLLIISNWPEAKAKYERDIKK